MKKLAKEYLKKQQLYTELAFFAKHLLIVKFNEMSHLRHQNSMWWQHHFAMFCCRMECCTL